MISAVITAAGSSTRFGKDKMLIMIDGAELIKRTVQAFIDAGIEEIIVVTNDVEGYNKILGGSIKIIAGGKNRVESLLNGVKGSQGEIVITHDGARPLVSVRSIKKIIAKTEETGATITAVNPTATVKLGVDTIEKTLPRETTWIAQTPQGFEKEILLAALSKAMEEEYFVPTDDSEIVHKYTGKKIHIVEGDHMNIKVTHPGDEVIVNALWRLKNENRDR